MTMEEIRRRVIEITLQEVDKLEEVLSLLRVVLGKPTKEPENKEE
jgi:hypothetical protein